MALLTPNEAANFLKVSRSTIYQRRDIQRYRLPGSRAVRFDEAELLAWAKGERRHESVSAISDDARTEGLDNGNGRVYHRNALYRDTCEGDRL